MKCSWVFIWSVVRHYLPGFVSVRHFWLIIPLSSTIFRTCNAVQYECPHIGSFTIAKRDVRHEKKTDTSVDGCEKDHDKVKVPAPYKLAASPPNFNEILVVPTCGDRFASQQECNRLCTNIDKKAFTPLTARTPFSLSLVVFNLHMNYSFITVPS